MANKTYDTKCLVHFESVGGRCNVQNDHADDHAYAIEKQIIGFHLDGAAVHRDWH